MANTLTKGLIQRNDFAQYDGITTTASRGDGAGGTVTGVVVGDAVDVLMAYGSGTNYTSGTIQAAVDAVGSNNVAFSFAPGTWTMSTAVTIPSNVTCVVPAGCVFDVTSAGLTIEGVFFRQHATYETGGTVTINGTDILAANTAATYTAGYAADTGSANTYAIAPSPAIASYSAGQTFRFRVLNTNTGASTLNVNTLGAKNIVQADGSTALAAGDLTADQIVQVTYDATGDEFHLVPTAQPSTSSGADLVGAVIDTRGDIATRDGTGVVGLAVGTADQYLKSDGTDVAWATPFATQAQMETGTSNVLAVTPGRAQNHQSASKCWGTVSYSGGVPTSDLDYNVTSITDKAAGQLTVTVDTDFSSANYVVVAGTFDSDEAQELANVFSQAAGTFDIYIYSTGGAAGVDPNGIYWACFGDQ